ncbi:hypothetical protein PILCRDRAFT_810385 [Piloderma croceum F 1598]|uniref:Uncharacterized protein n=1 Tax=Piloderma croceum (strain F 1598) TaxID=765440 RepID=A0A0C3GL81_PILCF|nr:hypothetical protein PILCRDRAFT_810385 [Piloderma croceum F 1598]
MYISGYANLKLSACSISNVAICFGFDILFVCLPSLHPNPSSVKPGSDDIRRPKVVS